MVIGGAEDKIRDRVILNRFATLAGGPDAVVVVISTASSLGFEAGSGTSSNQELRLQDNRLRPFFDLALQAAEQDFRAKASKVSRRLPYYGEWWRQQ